MDGISWEIFRTAELSKRSNPAVSVLYDQQFVIMGGTYENRDCSDVTVFDDQRNRLLKTKTIEEGELCFSCPSYSVMLKPSTVLSLVVDSDY